MATRDLYNDIKTTSILAPINTSATVTSSAVDIQGYEGEAIAFAMGLSGDTLNGSNFWTLSLTECATVGGSYTAVAATDVIVDGGTLGTTSTYAVNKTGGGVNSDSQVVKFGYRGGLRFVKAVATKTGTMSVGTPIGIVAISGRPAVYPAV